ncbi:putative ABC transport system permease protein [Clostridium acetobutylicum]|uniref:Predicted membrane protein n=1 Tax=Clostridium acetobutylicum (strain ATCC 824 / DSM 792 / JCM 1419 / IAM 19013 / LMG 5710 / NBRC 13948 / NRRL B-527 / VKM B-1787 / 2291 / W) TaxID=272562 RepID=Q97KU3_CLOAB|nr:MULTISPECIES: FtsX-like permease family protein [Clostridium]AAK78799.1 Predicted membrane protein [Clostridium acetobutylicum ATCC 824]ADZ19873.1 membrane protein [Clostridium acetobutylicum EA 2018]AEI31459.1 hypothetical protein SMB_G0839 [Clostridium acetobutylicum DSM 1731]AWV80517.1 ABC transporter permease [Clostridium acetobutylicum]MBC2392707.1 FtsX-like permease family protein [Clostridium acetobutylicum]
MKKTFFKNLFKSISTTLSRFLSILIIIAVGVSFYVGVRASSPDMKMSADKYFNDSNFMDFKLISTLGLTDKDVKEVRKLSKVKAAKGSKSMDAVIENGKDTIVLNVESLPKKNGVNKVQVVRGRLPSKNTELAVEERFLKENKFKIGDVLKLKSGNDTNIEDRLKNCSFKIVGTVTSPLYISAQRQISSVGNGNVKGFVYIMPEAFKNDVYTSIYVKINEPYSKDSLAQNAKYKASIVNVKEKLKTFVKERGEARRKDIVKDSEDKIKDAEDKLSASKKEAQDKFIDAHKKLDDAVVKLNDGKVQLQKNQNDFKTQITSAENEIQNKKSEIQQSETIINSKLADAQKSKSTLEGAENQIVLGQQNLDNQKHAAAEGISAALGKAVSDAKNNLKNNPSDITCKEIYNNLNDVYTKDIQGKEFDDMYESLKSSNSLEKISSYFDIKGAKAKFDSAQSEISSKKQTIQDNEKALISGEVQLQNALNQINAGKDKIAKGETELNSKKNEGLEKLNAAKRKIDDSEKEINENTEKLKTEETNANNKFNNAEGEIRKNRDKLNEVKKPDTYVLGRNENLGYVNYSQDSDRIDNIGKVFPLIFFLVAALVSLTTMTRMVQENRTEIGTFKALGYSPKVIVSHYLIYSFTASIIGSLLGIIIGFEVFPPLIVNAYGSLYAVPHYSSFDSVISIEAVIIAVVFTTVASAIAVLDELKEVPASLMRPKPPKAGKKILLERMTFIWKRFSFTKKVTARNIFRYKQRFLMTVIGIAACTGLMITGFGIKSGVIGAVEKQFSSVYKYDMQTTINKNIDDSEKKEIKDKVNSDSNIKSVLFYYSKNATVRKEDNNNEDINIVVPEKKAQLNEYIELFNDSGELKLSDDGVIVTEKIAKLMNKKKGDVFNITVDNRIIRVKIFDITKHYIQHYIYMSPKYYKKVTGENAQFNAFYGLLKSKSSSAENTTSKIISGIKNIGAVSFKNNTRFDFNKSTKSLNSVVLVLIVSAGVLAFVVIYNLTNININERNRELATIKVLGFYDKELAMYIYRENIILTIIGSLVGIGVGMLLDVFVITTTETNVMMFLRTVEPLYILISIFLTIAFSVIVNIAMYRRFYKIDMIESLKSAE